MQQYAGDATFDNAFAVDENAVPLEFVDRFSMTRNTPVRHFVICVWQWRHEFDPGIADCVCRLANVVRADSDVLNALALVLPEIRLNLAVFVSAFIYGDADFSVGGSQGP